jgi:cellulose synthase/poly-beta-1,6-N-acetylglucosamine synthase-like glycosyltransferase
VCSLLKHESHVVKSNHSRRFIILIPSYKSDKLILDTVNSILGQTYAQRNFDIVVISDHQGELVNMRLAQLPITLLTPNFVHSTHLKSVQYAMLNLPQFKIYDAVILLNAGDIVEPEFLEQVNDAFESAGTKVIQTHCLARNRNVPIARLDAIFEEINNSIFRRGHQAVGLSAALGNSGCVFDFLWFKQNILKMRTFIGEDKEMEAILMREGIYIDYFDNIHVYDMKVTTLKEFNEQRSRWTYIQLHSLVNHIRHLPSALFGSRYDQVDKIIQWLLVPRTIMIGIICIMALVLPFIYFRLVIKWWIVAAVSLMSFAIATPNYLIDKNWDSDFLRAPLIAIGALLNIFRAGKDEAGNRISAFGDMVRSIKRRMRK